MVKSSRLILSMFAREIVLSGCMTQFGLKHANQFNQFNLASDIMEPFRPIIDRIVYENRSSSFVKIKRELDVNFTLASSVKAIPASKPVSGNVFIFCNALNGLPLAMIFVSGLFLFSDDLRAEGAA